MPPSGIRAKCRRCGKESPVDEFILDPVYKVMVCVACVKERRLKENMASKLKEKKKDISSGADKEALEARSKPKGWDSEDEYLERAYKQKIKNRAQAVTIDRETVKYECPKCKYSFVYNVLKKIPSRCPYCGSEILPFEMG